MVFKPTLHQGARPIISRRLGSKAIRLVYAEGPGFTQAEPVPDGDRSRFSLTDPEVLQLATWACEIEKHYSEAAGHPQPMDIEWAKDGISGELFIVQARPETVHSKTARRSEMEVYTFVSPPPDPLVKGQAVGQKIGSGRVRVVHDPSELAAVQAGDVLVARNTNPDWEPVMRRVAAIITDQGGRTAHAAIVSRELGLPCVVGAGNATAVLAEEEEVTVSCAGGPEGRVYRGRLDFTVEHRSLAAPEHTRTQVTLNIADPSQAFELSMLPVDGVGLARIEFIITNEIGMHPMAAATFADVSDKELKGALRKRAGDMGFDDVREFFVTRLAEGIARIAAAFYPRPVIVRTSDFKTNEYARLLGGSAFEPKEENPMLGFRGASRYYDDRYRAGFALECAALKKVRVDMGLTNVRVMIPFCRTVQEGSQVIAEMQRNGLRQGEFGLEVYAMCELPSNALNADAFLKVFDGFSIGSNDLTQLVLGIDRDSGTIAGMFDEEDPAVKQLIAAAIAAARRAGKPIGICGQAPSDRPQFAKWLVTEGISSISLNADAVVGVREEVSEAELANEASGPFLSALALR
jgi:pyruvate,water dikinase